MKQNPTTAIKAKFSNEVHKLLEPNINVKSRERWAYRQQYQLTDKQKIELFDKIVELHKECSAELTSYQYDRRKKKRVQKARIARGWKTKKHTSKEEYLKTIAAA